MALHLARRINTHTGTFAGLQRMKKSSLHHDQLFAFLKPQLKRLGFRTYKPARDPASYGQMHPVKHWFHPALNLVAYIIRVRERFYQGMRAEPPALAIGWAYPGVDRLTTPIEDLAQARAFIKAQTAPATTITDWRRALRVFRRDAHHAPLKPYVPFNPETYFGPAR